MKTDNIIVMFVYQKDGVSKVLSLQDPKDKHNELINNGWKHVSTVNPLIYIEHLLNNNKLKNFQYICVILNIQASESKKLSFKETNTG